MRKTLAIIMMIAMVFCYMPLTGFADTEVSTTSVNTSGFIDMPNNWSTEALSKAVGNGLLEGFKEKSGTFIKPSDPLTRAQMATIVNRAFGAKGTANLTGVKDVPQKAWYTAEMQKAVKMGTMKLDSKMRPNDPITRQEAFTVLARAFKMADGTMANLEKFSDKEKVSSWAVSSLGALARVGYIQGADGKLNPLSKITRAEFAVVMDNMIKEYINKAGTVTQVHEGNLMINVPDVILKDITVKGDLILGDGIGEGNVTLENVIVKGNLIARGGGVNSIVINGGGVDGKVVIAKVDGQIRVFVNGAQVDVVVIDDGKDDVIIEGTVGTVEVTAPNTPIIVQNATITKIDVKSEGAANVTVASGSTVTNVVVGTGSTGTTLNVEGRVTNVETSAANTNVGGTGTVTTVTTNEGANNTAVTTPSTKVNNEGATGVTAGGGTEVPSGSTATNSNTGGEATVQPTTGGTTGGGGSTTLPQLSVAVSALTNAPIDDNVTASQGNQNNVTVSQTGNTITVTTTLSALNSFASTNISQGEAKWVGLIVDTGEASIIGVSYNGTPLSDGDVADANSVGAPAGSFVLWIKSVEAAITPKTFTLTKTGKTATTITINVVDSEGPMINSTRGEGYATIQEAISAATSGDAIVLGSNTTVAETVRITSGQSITLDLNGYTIDTSKGVYVSGQCTGVITVDGGNLTIEGPGTVDGIEYDDYAVEVRGGGTVTINGGTFKGSATAVQASLGNVYINGGSFEASPVLPQYQGTGNGYQFTVNCIDANYKNGTAIIEVTGGTFYKFNPGDNLSEGPLTNYLAPGYQATADGDNYVVSETPAIDTESELQAAVANGGTVTLGGNITLSSALIVNKTVILNLNGYTIDTSKGVYVSGECTGVITVDAGNLTIEGTGTVDGIEYDDYAVEVRGGGTVTINGGTFKGSATAVQASLGNVYINGGSFEASPVLPQYQGTGNGYQFTVNCIDANYKNGTAIIVVTGGTFYRFNPGDNLSEGPLTNYLAPGYQATAHGDNYVVSATA